MTIFYLCVAAACIAGGFPVAAITYPDAEATTATPTHAWMDGKFYKLPIATETVPTPATPHTYGHHDKCRDSIMLWADVDEYRFTYDVNRQTYGCNPWDVPAHLDQHRLNRAFQNGTAFTCTPYAWARTPEFPVVWWCVADEQPGVEFSAFIHCPRVPGTTLDVYARDCVVEFKVVRMIPFWCLMAVTVAVIFFLSLGIMTESVTMWRTWRSKRKMS